jgi:SAM-dependent methyltransferase
MTTLNLGCGNVQMDGAVNHDLVQHSSWVDVAHDLEVTPWPWADDTFETVWAMDLLEHLHLGFIGFFNEVWRILQPGGVVLVRTPMWNSPNAVIDPTHVRCYHPESFHYLDPATQWGQKYSIYTTRKWQIEQLGIDLVNIHARLKKVVSDG